jgi:hypothetical protein
MSETPDDLDGDLLPSDAEKQIGHINRADGRRSVSPIKALTIDERLAQKQDLFLKQAQILLAEVRRARAFGQWRIKLARLEKTMQQIEELCRPPDDDSGQDSG